MIRRGTAALLLAAALAACGAPDPLDGTSWSVVELGPRPSLPEISTTASFGNGRVSGSGGCNTYEGTYETEGDAISFGAIGGTEMACEDLVNAQERAFYEALADAVSYQVVVDRLELRDAGGDLVAAFRRRAEG